MFLQDFYKVSGKGECKKASFRMLIALALQIGSEAIFSLHFSGRDISFFRVR